MCVGSVRRRIVLFSPFVFLRGVEDVAPYKNNKTLSLPVGAHILAKQVCYEAKRNIESPVSLFALSFGFAQTNDCPQTL